MGQRWEWGLEQGVGLGQGQWEEEDLWEWCLKAGAQVGERGLEGAVASESDPTWYLLPLLMLVQQEEEEVEAQRKAQGVGLVD